MNKFSSHTFFGKAAFFLSCFFFFACENSLKEINDQTSRANVVEEVKDVETLLSQSGQLRARLTSPYMLRYSSDTQYVIFPRTLNVSFYDSTGRADSRLFARWGKYYETLNKVYLRDSVIVYNTQGDTLQSPDLWWDQNQQKFYTDKRVKIRKGGNIFYGVGFEAKQDLTELHLSEGSGLLYVKDSTMQ